MGFSDTLLRKRWLSYGTPSGSLLRREFDLWSNLWSNLCPSGVSPAQGSFCCHSPCKAVASEASVFKIPPPRAFLLLSGRYVEQRLPSPWRKLLCDFLWHDLGHQLALDFYPRPMFTKLCELKKNFKQKSQSPWKCFYTICCTSKVLKGLVFSEGEMWKEWQFALVWSLEERVCL